VHPESFLRCLPSEKKASPASSPDSTGNSPHHSTQSSQAWLLPVRRPVAPGMWETVQEPSSMPLTKGGWRGRGRCPSTSRTTGQTGSRQENRVKRPFSRARRRGHVDTALAHPYILLFDPTATPVAFNGHWRLSQRVPPTMFIRRDRIVSTGFPGPNAPWKRPGRGAEGVVESRLVDFGRFVWFFFRLAWLRSVGQG
jgi:hypothetical protein